MHILVIFQLGIFNIHKENIMLKIIEAILFLCNQPNDSNLDYLHILYSNDENTKAFDFEYSAKNTKSYE